MCNLSLEDANVGFIDKTVIRKEKHQGKEKEKKATRTRRRRRRIDKDGYT